MKAWTTLFPDYPDEPNIDLGLIERPVEGKVVNRPKEPTSYKMATYLSMAAGSAFMLMVPTWLSVAWFIAVTGFLCSR
jgi:hypothetical protein